MMAHRHCLAALAFVGLSQAASAASGFGISPLRLELSAARPMGSFTLSNSGDTPVVIQAQARQWRQAEGRDVLDDTRAFLVNPAIVRLQPGESQVVRVALRAAPDRERELGYRMHFTEVPQADDPAPDGKGLMNVRLVKRMDVPVFVAPVAGKPRAKGTLRAYGHENALTLDFSNSGTAHWRVGDVEVTDARTGEALASPFVVSVLPGGQRVLQFPVRPDSLPESVRVKADVGGQPYEAQVEVERAR